MNGYGKLSAPAAALIAVGYCLIMGMHHGVFGSLVVLMASRSSLGNRRPLFMARFFGVAMEFLRDRVTGVPWQPLGGAQVDNIPFARISEITGVYGLSFAVMLVNCAFAAALLLYGRRRLNLLISAAAAAIALQMGVFAKPAPFPTNKEATLLQANIPVLDPTRWTPQFFDNTLDYLARLSVDAAGNRAGNEPGLIVWPEAPAPFYVGEPKLQHWLAAIAQDTNSFIVVGSTAEAESPTLQGHSAIFNSALGLDPAGRALGRHDK